VVVAARAVKPAGVKKAAVTIVADPSGHILLLRRGPSAPWRPGYWNLPGGKIDPPETPRGAAARELAEESGISLSPSALTFVGRIRWEKWLTSVFFVCLPSRPPISFPDREHDSFLWADPRLSLPSPALRGVRLALRSTRTRLATLDRQRRMGEGASGDRMAPTWPTHYAHWPEYLPFPTEIPRNPGYVPNRQSVTWPQSQFAPLYNPPGSPSFQPYRYAPGGPLTSFTPNYFNLPAGALASQTVGPAGDIDRLPPSYSGAPMYRNPEDTETEAAAAVLLEIPVEQAPAEAIVPESAEVVAAIAFAPMNPELYAELGPGAVTRIQRIEKLLTVMESNQDRLGTRALSLQGQLQKIHGSIEYKLENHLGLKFRRRRAKRFDSLLKTLRRKRATKIQDYKAEKKSTALDQVRVDYQTGTLDKPTAHAKSVAIMKAETPEQYKQAKTAGLHARDLYRSGHFSPEAMAKTGDYTTAEMLKYAHIRETGGSHEAAMASIGR